MSKNNHKLGIKLPNTSKYCMGIRVYIDRERINAIRICPISGNGRMASEQEVMDLEFNVSEIEVRDIEDVALLMNKETFEKFCELWRGFHGEQ